VFLTQRQAVLVAVPGVEDLIHYAVDERFWAATPPVHDGYVVATGRDLARDYATFAAAMEHVAARGLILTARQNMAGVRLPGNVEARFDVSQQEVRDIYARASCVVIPTRRPDYPYGSEGSGTTSLLETMAMARPTVVSERPDLVDYIRPGQTALSVPPEDPGSLRSSIERILSDRQLAESLSAAGRRLVEEEHTTRRFAEKLAKTIRTLPKG